MNIVKNRYYYFLISLLIIVPGMIALIIWGLPLGIDFTGGSLLEIKFANGTIPTSADITAIYKSFSTPAQPLDNPPVIQPIGTDSLSIRSQEMDDATKTQVVAAMQEKFSTSIEVLLFTQVSASVGKEVATRAAGAVLLAAVAILLYITWAFRGVQHAFRYGVAAIIALLHDVLVVIGIEAIVGKLFGWQADSLFLTALLTVIGFSVHDTIVVFDRVRENARILRRVDYEAIVNHSIIQTLDRSINTQLTVLFTLFALVLFGGETIRHFVVILLIGMISGTYSSIFNASQILVVWENREWTNWFRRKPAEA